MPTSIGDWGTDDLAALAPEEHYARQRQQSIYAHHDPGNDFFALFLDPTMAYSSALFLTPGDSFEAAQLEKYRQWGERLQGHEHTVSAEQRALAAARVAAAGLNDRVTIELRDYRHIERQYQRIVSIEMLGAVARSSGPTSSGRSAAVPARDLRGDGGTHGARRDPRRRPAARCRASATISRSALSR